jgi:N-methylhydantoinase B
MHPHPGMLMLDLVIKSLAAVIPDCVAAGLPGDSWNVFVMGNRPDTGEFFVSGEAQEGGWGASAHADGESSLIHSAAGDFRNIPVETTESRHPIIIRRVALGRDSGGAGECRGGLNVVKEYELLTDSKVTLHFDRAKTPQWGLFGARAGAVPKVTLYPSDADETVEVLKVEQYPLKKGSRLVAESGGGGGYGSPLKRDPERVRLDVLNGYVSKEAAREVYGVVLIEDPDPQVDRDQTNALRVKLAADQQFSQRR